MFIRKAVCCINDVASLFRPAPRDGFKKCRCSIRCFLNLPPLKYPCIRKKHLFLNFSVFSGFILENAEHFLYLLQFSKKSHKKLPFFRKSCFFLIHQLFSMNILRKASKETVHRQQQKGLLHFRTAVPVKTRSEMFNYIIPMPPPMPAPPAGIAGAGSLISATTASVVR